MIDWSSFFLGMLSAFILSAAIVALIVWYEQRCKRRRALEQFEHVSAEQYATKIYAPSYSLKILRIVK